MGEPNFSTFAARLASFEQTHHPAKRRVSNARKKAPAGVTWPHTAPKPEDLARAGFFYRPSASSDDSVTCFLCDKALDGWEPGDDPAIEHINHVPHCGWAINVCIENRIQDSDRAEENPMSPQMVDARRSTFQDLWPHESRKGWKCKVKKMVDAGWCYTPLPEADDCVHCFYCGVSLDGWEPKDDPWDEHLRRAPECHFFTLIEQAKPKKGRASKARMSKTSRISSQSNTFMSEAPSMVSDNDEAHDEDTILTTISTKPKAKAKGKATTKRGKKKDESVIEDTETNDVVQEAPKKSKRTTKAKAVEEQSPPKTRPTRQRKVQADLDDTQPMDQSMASEMVTRGKKRTSDGVEKEDEFVSVLESLPEPPKPNVRKQSQLDSATKEVQPESAKKEAPAPAKEPAKPRLKAKGKKAKASVNVEKDEVEIVIASYGERSPEHEQEATPTPRKPAKVVSVSPKSDAENVPPSSRPSLVPVDIENRPPATPRASPSKRNIIAGVPTAQPWDMANLETVFALSPNSKMGQENVTAESIMQRLTSPEKAMTVEDWIRHNALRAEAKLKQECERLVATFEREGIRALASLEGIQAV